MLGSRIAYLTVLSVAAAAALGAQQPQKVQSLLAACGACHNSQLMTSGLSLESREAALAGGGRGPAISPGHPEQSLLIEAVRRSGDLKMPPGKALSADDVAALETWIASGAEWDADETAQSDAAKPWAFRVPQRPTEPDVQRTAWIRNPIDRFVLARMEEKGIAPADETDRHTLLRRVSLDLIGLLPTQEEIDAFVADESPAAYEKVVDRLLASKHFGERWGRHWLDLARYADSDGYSIDAPRPIWKYRDWVVNALNDNQPFDEFVIDQIAGDLRPNPTTEQLIATGFHRNTPHNLEGGIDVEQYRVEAVADRVATTGSVFLGLTVGCARCHDHKYDPIKQKEFYQLFAFYNNTVETSQLLDRYKTYEPVLETPTPPEAAQADAYWAQVHALSSELVDYIAQLKSVPRSKEEPAHRDDGLLARVRTLREFMSPVSVGNYRWRKPLVTRTLITRELPEPRETFIHEGGDFLRHGERVYPGVPAALSSKRVTGDRMDLAKWLVSPENPLTARVTLNRAWQRYFGEGIVQTENDFGAVGAAPTHPELLDWLATEFIARNWDVKAMHRLIVTSATYRQSSQHRPELDEVDPYNNFLAHQARIRLDAEIVRDAALAASGLLTDKLGGPGVYPPIPEGAMANTQITREWPTEVGPDRYRRGIYTFYYRQSPPPSLALFDAPKAMESCTRRTRSNSPLQALTLLNDQTFMEFAFGLAKQVIEEESGGDRARLNRAFLRALSREPLPAEADRVLTFLSRQREEYREQPSTAVDLIAAHQRPDTETTAVDIESAPELAAWTAVARVLLNLDDFMTRE